MGFSETRTAAVGSRLPDIRWPSAGRRRAAEPPTSPEKEGVNDHRQYARLSAFPFRQPARRSPAGRQQGGDLGMLPGFPSCCQVLAPSSRTAGFSAHCWCPPSPFAALSLVRRALNFRRPYEVLDIDPIIQKGHEGKSMPKPARLFHLCHRHDLSLDRAVAGRRPARPRRGAGL